MYTFIKEERECITIPIDEIYCKHESCHDEYRNNYRNQLKEKVESYKEKIRNARLISILREKGSLYPIALYKFKEGYMCVDGHHRIKAYLKLGFDEIPGIVYKNLEEALMAKKIKYIGD